MAERRKYSLAARIIASIVSATISVGIAVALYDSYMPSPEQFDGSFSLPDKDGKPLFVIPQKTELAVEANRPLSFRKPNLDFILPWQGELIGEFTYGEADSPLHFHSHVVTDQSGFRNPKSHNSLQSLPVLCIGDSFLEGLTVSNKNLVTALIENETGLPTYNSGLTGIGLADELYILRRLSKTIRPRVVLWFLFEGNDFGSPHSQRPTCLFPVHESYFGQDSSPQIDPQIFENPVQPQPGRQPTTDFYSTPMLFRYIPQHPFKTRLEEASLRRFFSEIVQLQKAHGFVVEFLLIPSKGRAVSESPASLKKRLPDSFGDPEHFRRDVLSIARKLLQDSFMQMSPEEKSQQRELKAQNKGVIRCLDRTFEFADSDPAYRTAWNADEVASVLEMGREFIIQRDLYTYDLVSRALAETKTWQTVQRWSDSNLPAKVSRLCAEHGLGFTDLTKALQEYSKQPVFLPTDTHFSVNGHAAAAEVATELLREKYGTKFEAWTRN